MLIHITDIDSLKKALGDIVTQYGQDRKLNQKAMSSKIGISQPRYSNLANGKLEKFSMDSLLAFVIALDVEVSIQITGTEVAEAVVEEVAESSPEVVDTVEEQV
jgi:predicted XRE-type DNA-binding protein